MIEERSAFILDVDNLNISYGNFNAVKNISFHVKAGEIFGLLGPNGAGKTSTLSAIEGLIKPQSGNIVVAGYNIKDKPLHAKASMGIQLQSTNFQPELKVTEIIQLFAGIYGVELNDEKLETILNANNIQESADKKFGQLSGGQQQRVSLSLCVLHDPALLLLDEPTTGLDPQSRRVLWEKMEAIREKGHAILLTTHSMEEAEAVCDRIAIIDHGKIIAIDEPQKLIDAHRNDPEVIAVSRRGRITLEDVFIGLTGREVRS